MKKKKIAVIASSRATYGYKRKLIGMIHTSSDLKLQLIVTGMHLMKKYGYSVKDIHADGYPVAAMVDVGLNGDTPCAWTKSIGVEIQKMAKVFEKIKPDMVLVTGDRSEMFAAAVAAAYMNIAIAHIQAGDVSGHIDGSARHAITKLSHLHFAACQDSADRVRRLGEEKFRIFNVGAPQLDEIIHSKKLPKETLLASLGIDFNQPSLLVIQHPVLVEHHQAAYQMKQTMDAVKALKLQAIVIYPNVDAGGRKIIKVIKEYEHLPFIYSFRNLDRLVFLSMLSYASVLIGNSSCGILEAPSFKLPAVNIGDRQRGRMQAVNVINTGYNKYQIRRAVEKSLYDRVFLKRLSHCVNPYGDGNSSVKILRVLRAIKINKRFLDKRITY